MRTGLYKLVNTTNQHRYYGSAVDIEKRWNFHIWKLNCGRHENKHLQRAWNKYGERKFQFVFIRTVPKSQLIIEEQKLLNRHVGQTYCYNIASNANAPMLGRHHSASTKRKIGRANQFTTKLNGELNGSSKLTESEIQSIRSQYPQKSSVQLAREFHVTKKAILDILHRRTWKHL